MGPIPPFLIASLFFVALAWGPAAAHLLELPAKLGLGREDYQTVQQIYRGWALLGVVVFAELVATGGFAWLSRARPWAALAAAAFLFVVAAQILFWVFTFPANQATANWTMLPADWSRLRVQWEYSHLGGAGLTLAAFVCLLLAARQMLERRWQ
jgi:hypothetical protein